MKRLAFTLITIATLSTACTGNVFSLEVGQCFNDPDNFAEVSNVAIVDCSEPHDNEVFAIYDMDDLAYPGDAAAQEQATTQCIQRFDRYVGRDYPSSALGSSSLTPSRESWAQDDREVICFLYDVDLDQLTGSARNSGL